MNEFQVGMQVVCIQDHSLKAVRKGQSFIINNIIKLGCCGALLLDVGITTQMSRARCECGQLSTKSDRIYWIDASLFVPIHKDSFKTVTWKKIVKEIPVCAN